MTLPQRTKLGHEMDRVDILLLDAMKHVGRARRHIPIPTAAESLVQFVKHGGKLENRVVACVLHEKGWTYRKIGELLGVSPVAARHAAMNWPQWRRILEDR